MPEIWNHLAVDAGREFLASYTENGFAWKGVVPRELLNDTLGDNAPENERQKWVVKHGDEIFAALKAKSDGGFSEAPFDRIVFTEKN